ncbi:hypothetical protein TrRE_jg3202 [Triparma retinervis]|uniref:Homing endonuclease LAGLIDADG domain-containing protein n=1 Tax=Triparma retinervis TaxID=2557542 RepID=A0A9W7ADS6_9STRA|nr:hypothetical protein TrRE_jg3202 [Triparma retinervis]
MGDLREYERLCCWLANFFDADAHASQRDRVVSLAQSDLPLLCALKMKLEFAFGIDNIRIRRCKSDAYYLLHPNQKQHYEMHLHRQGSITLKGHLQAYSFTSINDRRGKKFWNIIEG